MKSIVKALLAAAMMVSALPAAQAQTTQATQAPAESSTAMSQGEVKKVDKSTGKLTIKHGPLKNLGMDAMTMVFRVKDPAMLEQVKAGDKIKFVAEEPNGRLTVTRLEKQG